MTIAEFLGLAGFVISSTLALFRIRSWWREPRFEVLAARVNLRPHLSKVSGYTDMLGDAAFTLVAYGGARPRRVLEWYYLVRLDEGPAVANGRPSPASIHLPQGESTNFTLTIDSVGLSVADESKLTATLHIRAHRTNWETLNCEMQRIGRGFELQRLDGIRLIAGVDAKLPLSRRIMNTVRRRFD